MSKKIFILSPCGTSVLTNLASNDERKLVFTYANSKTPDEIPAEDRDVLIKLIEKATQQFAEADRGLAKRKSAELNGIISYYNDQLKTTGDHHVLLCTDTWLGETTAKIIELWLKKQGMTVEVKRQSDLQTVNLMAFQLALSDIVKWCEETVFGYQTAGYNIVFNLTGGFKSVQGFLQTLALFYADETVYIFETSSELLKIPRLPVKMDAKPIVEKHLTAFRRLAMNLTVSTADTVEVPETLLLNIDQDITLSPWGEIIWQKTKKDLYREKLHSSPSDKIKFTDAFEKGIKELEKERLCMVNEKIDDLMLYLEKNINQKSLDFKALKGKSRAPSTHEIDAWADQDAKRIFGHFEDSVFVLDKLDKALHG